MRGSNGEVGEFRLITTQNGFKFYLPSCRHKPIMNRFNIHPGSRWDGVDRGNQYEQKWLSKQCEKDSKKQ